MSPTTLNYRFDIDGLRAIAVLSACLFHFFPSFVPGGFIGVDIFFVISGFLVSRIILAELKDHSFNFIHFYERRIKRLYPSLVFILGACFLYGYLILLPDEFQNLSRHIAHSGSFLSNRVLREEEVAYFEISSHNKPLNHLWSLSIEEQFYLIWPFCLWVIYRLFPQRTRGYLLLIGLVTLFSYGYFILYRQIIPVLSFYFSFSRFWELGLGALAAYFTVFVKGKKGSWREALALQAVSLTLIVGSLFTFSSQTFYFPLLILLPVGGTFLLCLSSLPTPVTRFLGNALFKKIAIYSYPFYLLHWPLLSFIHIIDPSLLTPLFRGALFLASFGLSFVLYWSIEHPLRTSSFRHVPTVLILAMGSLATFSYGVYRLKISSRIFSLGSSFQKVIRATWDWTYPPFPLKEIEKNFLKGGEGKESILFFGDSNMMQYAPRLASLIQKKKKTIFIGASSGFCPFPQTFRNLDDQHFWKRVQEYAHDPRIKKMVIGGNWIRYFEIATAENHQEYYYLFGNKKYRLESEQGKRAALQALENFISSLIKEGKKVYLILNMPMGPKYDPRSLLKRSFIGRHTFSWHQGNKGEWTRRIHMIKEELQRMALRTGAFILNPEDDLCEDRICKIHLEGDPVYRDATHLRTSYVKEHIKFLDFLLD